MVVSKEILMVMSKEALMVVSKEALMVVSKEALVVVSKEALMDDYNVTSFVVDKLQLSLWSIPQWSHS